MKRTENLRSSKSVPGVYYKTTALGANRWVTVTYLGKHLFQSPRPIKVSKYIKRVESEIEAFKEIMYLAYEGKEFNACEGMALRNLLVSAMEGL